MKTAHMTSRPDHQVGDKVLGLCGKEFKVKIKWDDIPDDHPICRPCVDIAAGALTQVDALIERTRMDILLLTRRFSRMGDDLGEELILDRIHTDDENHRQAREEKRVEKIARKRLKRTCTCTWSSPEVFDEDPLCPVHGQTEPEELSSPRVIETVELPDQKED